MWGASVVNVGTNIRVIERGRTPRLLSTHSDWKRSRPCRRLFKKQCYDLRTPQIIEQKGRERLKVKRGTISQGQAAYRPKLFRLTYFSSSTAQSRWNLIHVSYRRVFFSRFFRFVNFVPRYGGVLSQFVNFNSPGKPRTFRIHMKGRSYRRAFRPKLPQFPFVLFAHFLSSGFSWFCFFLICES